MKKVTALLYIVLILGVGFAQDDDQVAGATTLLRNLLLDEQRNLEDLNNLWATNQPLLHSALEQVVSQHTNQVSECNNKTAIVAATQQEIDNCEHYVDWIANKIQENTRRITELEENRCDQSKLYVETLKHNKIALSLIEFLKHAIAQRDSLSLAQRDEIFRRLAIFMQMYSDHKIKELIQKQVNEGDFEVQTDTAEHERTQEEIGTGHIDQGGEQIAVEGFQSSRTRDWAEYKASLLQLLEDLESQITSQMSRAQDDEVNAGVSLAEFKIQVEKENQELDRFLYEEQARHGQLTARIQIEKNDQTECGLQLETVHEQLVTAQGEYDAQVQDFEMRKRGIDDNIETYRYVLTLYTQSVAEQAPEYHDRLSDYLNDAPSTASTYGSRRMDQFNSLGN